jgi:hypothetical protein
MRRPRHEGQKPRCLHEKVRHEAQGGTDDLKDVILAWVGPGEEGDRERRLGLDRRPATAERSEMPAQGGLPQVPR